MSLTRKVAYNTALQAGGKIAGTVIGFVVIVILYNYLGKEYNAYTTVLAYLQAFTIVLDLGLYVMLLKRIANDDAEHSYTNSIISLRFFTAVIVLIIACFGVWLIQAPAYTTMVKWGVTIAAGNFFFITVSQLLMGVYQHALATRRIAIAEICGKIVLLALTLIVVYILQWGILAVLATVTLAGLVNFFILWTGLKKYGQIRLVIDWLLWKKTLRESWPIAIAIAFNLIYFKADTVILSFFKPDDVGTYGFPYKILEVIITLPAIVVGLLMPKLSAAFSQHNRDHFQALYQRSFYALSMVAVPLVVGSIMIAHPLMDAIVTKPELREHLTDLGNLLQILMVAVGMIFFGTLTGYVVVVVNRQRQIIFGYAFVAVTALIGYLWFIPQYSYYGAAWITVYSEAMMVGISSYLIWRTSGARPRLWQLWRVGLAGIIMAVVLFLVSALPLPIFIICGGMVYATALVLVGGISRVDLQELLHRKLDKAPIT